MFVDCIIMVIFLSFLFMPDAHAYIDPGTGSMLLQALAAGAVTLLVFGKRIYYGIAGILRKPGASQTETNDTEE